MKKILFILPLMAMSFTACGNKTVPETELTDSDTIVLDTVEPVDTVSSDTIVILDKVF